MTELGGGDETIIVAIEDLSTESALIPYTKRSCKPTLNASLISSSESVSFIFLAIMVRNSTISLTLPSTHRAHNGMHTWEVDSAIVVSVNLVDHVLQFGFGRVLAKRSHNGAELLSSDLSCGVISASLSTIPSIPLPS